jgi:MFS family permease
MNASPSVAAADDAASQRTTPYAWTVLGVLMFIYIFNFLDRQLMAILQEPIKAELKLSDAELGRMTGLYFALVYTVLGVFVGYIADRTNRRNLLFAGCFLWSLFTVLCGLAKTYPMMLAARMGVGVGEAAGAPPSYSIISDYFPAHKRGMALAIFSLGVPFGLAAGSAFGASLANLDIHWTIPILNIDIYKNWRVPFILIGGAGILAAFLLLVVVREPKRGAMDVGKARASADAGEKSSFIETTLEFFRNPVLFWTAMGCGLFAFVGYAASGWNVSFLIRVKGINFAEVATWYSLMIAVFAGAGTLLSGVMVDWMGKRSKVWYGLLPMIAIGLSLPCWILFVYAPTWQASLAILALPTFFNIFYLAPALAVVQNMVKPSQRTLAGALLLLVNNLIGLGLGPTFVGEMSSYFATTQGDVKGLESAMFWVWPFYAIGVAVLLMETLALKKAEQKGETW